MWINCKNIRINVRKKRIGKKKWIFQFTEGSQRDSVNGDHKRMFVPV